MAGRCSRTSLNLLNSNKGGRNQKIEGEEQMVLGGQIVWRRRRSGERNRTFPRCFRTAPLSCHLLNNRLAVNGVTLAAPANSSFVASNSNPPETFSPMVWARQTSTPASL